jgi:SAM-dependent methyltransferase
MKKEPSPAFFERVAPPSPSRHYIFLQLYIINLNMNIPKLIKRKVKIVAEKMQGLDFLQVINPRDLGFDEAIVYRGSPSGNIFLSAVLDALRITKEDSILDIGCAKGSAIRTMSSYPFDRVDGIELSPRLSEIARRNFRKLDIENVAIFNINAIDFTEYGKYNIFYLYNPFPESVLEKVVGAIVDQSDLSRERLIIYNNPAFQRCIESHNFFKKKEYPDEWGSGIFVYSNMRDGARV